MNVSLEPSPSGARNALTDLPGVRVGHRTLLTGDLRTGVTAFLFHTGNLYREKVPAAAASSTYRGTTYLALVQARIRRPRSAGHLSPNLKGLSSRLTMVDGIHVREIIAYQSRCLNTLVQTITI